MEEMSMNKLSCEKKKQIIAAAAKAEALEPNEKETAVRHLRECSVCKQALRYFYDFDNQLISLLREDCPSDEEMVTFFEVAEHIESCEHCREEAGTMQEFLEIPVALPGTHTLSHLALIDGLARAGRDPNEVLPQIGQLIRSQLGADLIIIYEYIGELKAFKIPPLIVGDIRDYGAMIGAVRPYDIPFRILQSEEGVYASDVRMSDSLFNRDKRHNGERNFVERESISSAAAMPLVFAGNPVGVIFVNYRQPQSFPHNLRDQIVISSGQVTTAIGITFLYEKMKHYEEILKEFLSLKGLVDISRLLYQFNERVASILRTENAVTWLKKGEALIVPKNSAYPSQPDTPEARFEVTLKDSIGTTAYMGRCPTLYNLVASDLKQFAYLKYPSLENPILPSGRSWSLLSAPIYTKEGELLGLVKAENKVDENGRVIEARQGKVFTRQDEELICRMARMASTFIEPLWSPN
jgi:hypothetical protein